MKQLTTASAAFAASWAAAYVLTGLAFTSSMDGSWLLFSAPAAWLLAIVLTLWMLELKGRGLSWVFLVIAPFGWLVLLLLRSKIPGQPSTGREGSAAARIFTSVFLGMCSLVFIGSASAGIYFNLRPSAYPAVIQKVTAVPVSVCFFLIGLIWARFAVRKARGLEF